MAYILSIIIGYLLGCIQTAYLAGKLILKKDIRELGNGNAGASNATVVFGRSYGIGVALIDILKGAVAVIVVRLMFRNSEALVAYEYLAGCFAVLGHNFPFYMNFKGGKGTATAVGVLFGFDWRLGLVAVVLMLVVVLVTDYIAIGTVALILLIVTYTAVYQMAPITMVVALGLAAMSLYKHRENFVKIRRGEEKHVRQSFFGKKTA